MSESARTRRVYTLRERLIDLRSKKRRLEIGSKKSELKMVEAEIASCENELYMLVNGNSNSLSHAAKVVQARRARKPVARPARKKMR